MQALHRLAAAFTALGLLSGLYYREMTRDHTGAVGQLPFAHTHFLALGTLVLLVVLALEATLRLSAERLMFRVFLWAHTLGLTLTGAMMLVKGTMTVKGVSGVDSPALAGVSGLGHIAITVGFVALFVALGRRIGEHRGVEA